MGSCYSSDSKSDHLKLKQQRNIDQNYVNHIMLICFSTLQSICLKILSRDAKPKRKIFGLYDQVNFSQKSIPELERQLQIMLTLFKFSTIEMKNCYKEGFLFPSKFPRGTAIDYVDTFQKICLNACQTSYNFCNDFKALLNNSDELLSFETARIDGESNNVITNRQFVLNAIDATNKMDAMKPNDQQQTPQLTVDLQKTSFDYSNLTVTEQ